MISTFISGSLRRACTVARAGVRPGTTQASHTAFMAAKSPMSASQITADRIFVLSLPPRASSASISASACFTWPVMSRDVSSGIMPERYMRSPQMLASLSRGPGSIRLMSVMRPSLQRVRAQHFPVVARPLAIALGVAERPLVLEHLLDVLARMTRRIEEQRAPGAGTAVLPGMRHVARQERAGAGAAGENLVTDL